jgi:hypothetical protein
MQALLSFDQSPPLSAPLRFFLTAPLYLLLAGLLLAFAGESLFASRWTPAALAMTHLLTLGFMLQVMLGALIQILPVLAGANLPNPLLIARVVYPCLNLGVLALAAGFLIGSTMLMHLAALLLFLALTAFLMPAAWAVFGVPSTSPSIRGLKLSLLALLVTGALGIVLLLGLAAGWALPIHELTNLHAAWGLGGWSGILLAAVAYVVVPMFQMTPGYPARPAWWFPLGIMLALLMWSLSLLPIMEWLLRPALFLLAASGSAFVWQTLRLQRLRRRPRADVTLRYWQLGLWSSLVALLMLMLQSLFPAISTYPVWDLLYGVLILLGGFCAFIIGMLYKIVPFLLWLSLQNQAPLGKVPPVMNQLLSEADMQGQMKSFFVAFLLSTAAVLLPQWLSWPAGLALLVSGFWLAWNLLKALRRYRSIQADFSMGGA